MSSRKKKVEAALDKLFSTPKSKSGTSEPSPETGAEGSVAQKAPAKSRSTRTAKPAVVREPAAATEANVNTVEPAQEAPLDPPLETISQPAQSAQPTVSQASPLVQTEPLGDLAASPTNNSTQTTPASSSITSPPKEAGNGSAGIDTTPMISDRETASETVQQLVIFTIAGESFGLPINRVESIIKPQAITVVPHARPYVVGVTNLRGTVLPVIDLRRRFHLPAGEESEDQRIVVVLFNEEKIGIQVDSVSQVLSLPLSAIEPPPPIVTAFVHSAFVTGIAKVDEQLVILLDLEKILLPDNGN
ncbi:MAG: hypothetical protein Kow0088_04600 [Anaerolineales bacterium]